MTDQPDTPAQRAHRWLSAQVDPTPTADVLAILTEGRAIVADLLVALADRPATPIDPHDVASLIEWLADVVHHDTWRVHDDDALEHLVTLAAAVGVDLAVARRAHARTVAAHQVCRALDGPAGLIAARRHLAEWRNAGSVEGGGD